MFTTAEKNHLVNAVNLALTSSERARKNSKNPQLSVVYDQISTELTGLLAKVQTIDPIKSK